MNKVYAFLLFMVVLVCFTACGAGNIVSGSSSTTSQTSEVASSEVTSSVASEKEPKWETSLDGLIKCFEWHKFIDTSTKSDVTPSAIGANEGYRFVSTANGGSFNLELYYFDPSNPLEKKEEIINEVSSNGYFTLLGTQVQAVVSNNQKYLMVYSDTTNEEIKNQVYDIFKKFK